MLKSPPIRVGKGFCWYALTNSARKVDLKSSCAGLYTAIRIHLNLSNLLHI
jgi:hypothetical protein